MSTIGTVSPLAAASAKSTGSAGVDPAQALNDRFLKLLVAQLNNQDPLNPLDNAQITSQMAQISTVTGINNLSDSVGRLLGQFAEMQGLQAAQLTGRTVLVDGQELRLTNAGATAGFGVDLPSAADSVKVEIRDAAGALVRTVDLGRADAGINRFTWDGKTDGGAQAAAGKYSITVRATAGSKDLPAVPLVARTVDAVGTVNGTTTLTLAGGGTVSYADVRQIL